MGVLQYLSPQFQKLVAQRLYHGYCELSFRFRLFAFLLQPIDVKLLPISVFCGSSPVTR